MKRLALALLVSAGSVAAMAQTEPAAAPSSAPAAPVPPASAALSGDWFGDVDATALGGPKIPMVLHAGPPPTMDSPDQGAAGIPVTLTRDGEKVTWVIVSADATFNGKLSADGSTIAGELSQSGNTLPFSLRKKAAATP